MHGLHTYTLINGPLPRLPSPSTETTTRVAGTNMVSYPKDLRARCVEAYYWCHGDTGAAVQRLKVRWREHWGPVPKRLARLITGTVQRFERAYTLDDAPRSGRPRLLSEKDLNALTTAIKRGYTVSVRHQGQHVDHTERKWFTSMKEAAAHLPLVRTTLGRLRMDTNELLAYLRKYDRDLGWSTLDCKAARSPAQCQTRQRMARKLYRRVTADPSLLDRLVFADAGSIMLTSKSKLPTKVLCDVREAGVHSVLHTPSVAGGKPIYLRFYVAVSGKKGPLCIYLYTGTTQLKRRYVGLRAPPLGGFKVGVTLGCWGPATCIPCCRCARMHRAGVVAARSAMRAPRPGRAHRGRRAARS
jgi:transposase